MRFGENVDTRALLGGNVPARGPKARERQLIIEWWPADLVEYATRWGATWHALTEPPTWDDVAREDVVTFVREFIAANHHWPGIDQQRRKFGRGPTRRTAVDNDDQMTLAL